MTQARSQTETLPEAIREILVGVTGSIGSGKSRVAEYIRQTSGARLLSADQICRELLIPGTPGWQGLRTSLGDRFLAPDGQLERAELRQAIFRDPELRTTINAILHPLARQAMRAAAQQLVANGSRRILAEVPLLYEAGWEADFSRVLLVVAPDAVCIRRLRERDRVSRAEAAAALAAQIPQAEKIARADLVLDNGGEWPETRRRLRELLPRLWPENSEKS